MIRIAQVVVPAATNVDVLSEIGVPIGNYRIYIQGVGGTYNPSLVEDAVSATPTYALGLVHNRGIDTFNLPLHEETIFLRGHATQPTTVSVLLVDEAPSSNGPVSATFNY